MRDLSTAVPSSRRSTSMSRASHSTLRKAGFVITAAALPLILRLPELSSFADRSRSALDIDRLSLLKEGPDPFRKFLGAAAQDLVAILHRDHGFQRSGIDAHVETFLGQAQTHGRRRGHRVDIAFGGVIELALVDDLGDQPDRECAFGADEASREDQLRGNGDTDKAWEEI